MRHESWIMELKDVDKPCKVPQEYLKPMVAARCCAQEILMDQSLSCLGDAQSQLKANAPMLISMDRSFMCELEWLANSADECYLVAIHRAILSCLPSASSPVTMPQACMKLDALMQSDQAKFASLRSQSEIQTVRKILDKMVAGVPPQASVKDGGALFTKVWDRLVHFIMVEVDDPEACSMVALGVLHIISYKVGM